MPRPLVVVPDDAGTVLPALRRALAGGSAILPLADGTDRAGIPDEVPQRVALVVQSSGSTGTPKRVALSAEAVLENARASEDALGGPGQWLLCLPAHYIAGINVLARSIVAETVPVVAQHIHGDPQAFIDATSRLEHAARYTSLVPAQLAALLGTEAALETLRSFSRILVGGQSTPVGLLAQALELGLNITRSYGSSETSGGCVYDGVPIGRTAVRIVDGEVELGGPMLAEGYLSDDDRTARQFSTDAAGRWYRTSDAGAFTDGVLRVTGRIDDIIISGGVKVSLAAVERIVASLDGFGDAVVVGRADDRWGEVPVVVTVGSGSLAAVRAAVESALGPEARPADILVVESIPLLSSGKPDRMTLGRRAAAPPQ